LGAGEFQAAGKPGPFRSVGFEDIQFHVSISIAE
jgi:hypothetical protein